MNSWKKLVISEIRDRIFGKIHYLLICNEPLSFIICMYIKVLQQGPLLGRTKSC